MDEYSRFARGPGTGADKKTFAIRKTGGCRLREDSLHSGAAEGSIVIQSSNASINRGLLHRGRLSNATEPSGRLS